MSALTDLDARSRQLALLQLIGGAIMISFAAVFVRIIEVPPTSSAFYRTLVGGVVLGGVMFARRRPWRPDRPVIFVLLLAGLLFALDLAFWHRSILYLGPGLSTLLANFQVFVLAFAGILIFRETLRPSLAVGIVLAFAGLLLIVGIDWAGLPDNYRRGVVLGLLTALCYGAYVLALRRARVTAGRERTSPVGDVAIASVASAFFLLLIATGNGESLAIPNFREAGLLLAYGLVTQVAGWVLISSSLAKLPASRIGLVLLIQPTFAYLWDVLFFARAISVSEALGAGLALAGIYLGSRAKGV
ncbi:MAG: EamA family transporter [Gammaproteobacteria bacterium]|nr:EamA family transporter [Gammaproteobacteria bacterium]